MIDEHRSGPALDHIPFGPYAGLPLAEVVVMDPAYLLGLIREAIGPAELRAEAARELACRGRLGPGPTSDASGRALASWPHETARLTETAPHERDHPPGLEITPGATHPWPASGKRGILKALPGPQPWLAGAVVGLALLAALSLPGRWPAAELSSGAAPRSVASRHGSQTTSADGSGTASSDKMARGGSIGATKDPIADPAGSPAFDPSQPCGARVTGAIPATTAADFLDTFQAVEFEVRGTKDTGRVTFLNSHDPYQGHFYVAIFPDDYAAFPEHPARHFRGRCVVIQGSIETYRGTPQIVLRDPADIRVVEAEGASTGTSEPKQPAAP